MKIRPVGAELFNEERRTEGQTDNMTKLIVAFFFFANWDGAQERATSAVKMYAIQKPVQLHGTAHFSPQGQFY